MISSLPRDHSNIPNCHRQNLPKGRPKLPKSKADKGDEALRTSALRELKVKSLANPGIQPGTHAQPQFPAALRVSVGQRGTRGLLGRWRGWAWRLPRLGILAGGGAGWPFPSAFTVASVRYLHGSPSMRPGGAQVSVGKAVFRTSLVSSVPVQCVFGAPFKNVLPPFSVPQFWAISTILVKAVKRALRRRQGILDSPSPCWRFVLFIV